MIERIAQGFACRKSDCADDTSDNAQFNVVVYSIQN